MYNSSTQLAELHNNSRVTEVHLEQEECVARAAINWTVPCILLATVAILLKINDGQLSRLRHIPGPWIIPVLGTIHKVGFNPHLAFQTLGKIYGDIFRIRIGSQDIVVVRGLDTIRDALQKTDNFSGRPFLYTFQYLSGGESLSFSDYDQTFRKHKQLAEWSFSKCIRETDAINTTVRDEAQTLTNYFLSLQGKPLDPSEPVLWAIGHVLYNMSFGNSREETEDFEGLIRGAVNLIGMHNSGNVVNFHPLARKLLTWKVQEIKNTCTCMCKIAVGKEQEHLKTFKPGVHRDTMDYLIEASLKNKDTIGQDRVLHTCQDFLGAGLDIVYTAVTWAILYLAAFQDIQHHLRKELQENIEENVSPQKGDCMKLPFMQAFILEVLRHSSLVPLALPHASIRDSYLQDIMIPQGTFVLIDLYSIHASIDLWGDPERFRPERFLNSSGQLDHVVVDAFFPFGIGRRKCLGELFAKQEIAMFLSVLVQQCKISKPENVTDYDLGSVFGLILRPKPFQVVISPV